MLNRQYNKDITNIIKSLRLDVDKLRDNLSETTLIINNLCKKHNCNIVNKVNVDK